MRVDPTTIEEAVAAWNRGDEVRTVEMGGLGDGYEWAIQSLVFAILSHVVEHPEFGDDIRNTPKGERFSNCILERLNQIITEADAYDEKTERYKLGGVSAAQAAAAKSLALVLINRGYAALDDEAINDRIIYASKGMFSGWGSPEEAFAAGVTAGEKRK
jgi:hypothetical protein